MEKEIISVVKYFSFFAYQPTLEEIHTFLPAKISKNELKKELNRIVRQKKLLASENTPPQYSIKQSQSSNIKYQISKKKLNSWRFKIYIKTLSIFPQIKLIGLSGSIAMMSTSLDDDIDLFIITQKKRLFTGRFLAVIFAYLMELKRKIEQKKAPGKVCLNLFFDESNLRVPKFKHSEYVAHEVLQMKPIINKDQTYERFLEANEWVFKLFSNGKSKSQILNPKSQINSKRLKFKILNLFGTWNLGFRISNKIESLLKNLQLNLINRHKTTEIITSTQLWFHPDDFGKKIFTDY